ncbi:MFS transporter [Candidatus Woesearchaeota archaeon]|nr:MFS transporter [Candidatus Woesearchaeota archaeon]
MDINYKSNIWKMYLANFFASLHFIGGVLVPFFTDWGKLTLTQVMILQAWFMLCIVIMEVPSGAIADFIGRKKTLAIALIINIIGIFIYTSRPYFFIFMIGEFCWASAGALFSGAHEAFIYDTLKIIKKTKDSKKVFARFESSKLIGMIVSAPVGSIIASIYGLRATMFFIIYPLFITFIIVLSLKEPVLYKKSKNYFKILKKGVRSFYKNKTLNILAFDMVSIASISYFIIWLYQPVLKQLNINISYFGVVHALLALAQVIVINSYSFFERILSKKKTIFLTAFLTGAMFIISGLSKTGLLAIPAIILVAGFGLSRRPLFISYMNKFIPSSERATILSAVSMVRRLVLVIVNPIVGLLADWSLNFTLIILGCAAILFSLISRVEEEHLID